MGLCIIVDKDESTVPVRRLISAINHPLVNEGIIRSENKSASTKSDGFTHAVLVGTEMKKKYLGAGVGGNNAAVKVDGIWYFTLPNVMALNVKQVAIRAAYQILRAANAVNNPDFDLPKVKYHAVSSREELNQLVDEAVKSPFISFDFETNNMVKVKHPDFRVTCLGFCYTPGFTVVVPDIIVYENTDVLSKLFSCSAVKIAHNLSFDGKILDLLNISQKGQFACTMIMSQKIDENYSNGLKMLVDRYLPDFSGYDYHVDFVNSDHTTLYSYLATDCHVTYLLYCLFLNMMSEDPLTYLNFRNVAMPAYRALKNMEFAGGWVNTQYLEEKIQEIEGIVERRVKELQDMPEVRRFVMLYNEQLVNEEIALLEAKIAARKEKFSDSDRYITLWNQKINQYRSGELFCCDSVNFASPQQLALLFYSDIGFGFKKPMKKGADFKKEESTSTDKAALDDIDHPIALKLSELRTVEKMLATYYKGLLELSIDGKIYTNFNQCGTVTGRISSSEPNLQNLPTRVKYENEELIQIIKGVKKAFVAPQGMYVVQADLSQAELRVIACLSKDENMLQAYREGKDLHAITGSRIAGMENDFEAYVNSDKYKSTRQSAKSANFGLVYKISANGYIDYIKSQTGKVITSAEEKLHRSSVFGAYPRLHDWHVKYESLVRKHGQVRTAFGTVRHLPDIYSREEKKQAEAVRLAINSPVQGTIGEYALWLLVWLAWRLPEGSFAWLTVHDSVVLYCPIEDFELVKNILEDTAETIPWEDYLASERLELPLKIDVEYGTNYGQLTS